MATSVLIGLVIGLVIGGALGYARFHDGLFTVPWIATSRALKWIAAIPVVAGGVAAGESLTLASRESGLALSCMVLSLPLWAGPRIVSEYITRVQPRLRLRYLSAWAAAAASRFPPGAEPPRYWNFDRYMRELDDWSDSRTKIQARLLAARLRQSRIMTALPALGGVAPESSGEHRAGRA